MKHFSRLSTKLAFLYTLLFSLLSLLFFAFTYNGLNRYLQNDINSFLLEEAQQANYLYLRKGLEVVRKEAIEETDKESEGFFFVRIFDNDLNLIVSSGLSNGSKLLIAPPDRIINGYRLTTISLPDSQFHARILSHSLGEDYIIQIGASMHKGELLLLRFRTLLVICFPLLTIVGSGLSYLIAKRSLAGIEKVRKRSDEISRNDLSQAIPVNGHCMEVDNLTQSFNRMQNRIHNLVQELKEVSNNIAHDLRSPVTRIRGLAETTLRGESSLEEYRELAAVIIEESDNLVRIINDMLEMAQMDSGAELLCFEPVDLAELLRDIVDFFTPIAEDNGIKICLDLSASLTLFPADKKRLQRAVANLLDNALKFTPFAGTVKISAYREQGMTILKVKDSGEGITTADLPHIFERFYRGDQSRSRPGNGLGLSLVQAIIHAHKGHISAHSTYGEGTEMQLFFPDSQNKTARIA
jgi:heavy metal sensor kinase